MLRSIPRKALFVVITIVLSVGLVAAISIFESGISSVAGPTGGEIVFAALFVLILARSILRLVRKARAAVGELETTSRRERLDVLLAILPVATIAIIVVTTVVSLLALDLLYPTPREVPLFSALYLDRADVLAGQVWRLGSVMLLHGSVTHLVFNLWMLWIIGITEQGEAHIGSRIFFGAYVACGLIASLASIMTLGSEIAVGASGAIMGVVTLVGVRSLISLRAFDRMVRTPGGLFLIDDSDYLAIGGEQSKILPVSHPAMAAFTIKVHRGLRNRMGLVALVAVGTLLQGPLLAIAAGVQVDATAHGAGIAAGALIGLILFGREKRHRLLAGSTRFAWTDGLTETSLGAAAERGEIVLQDTVDPALFPGLSAPTARDFTSATEQDRLEVARSDAARAAADMQARFDAALSQLDVAQARRAAVLAYNDALLAGRDSAIVLNDETTGTRITIFHSAAPNRSTD